MKLVKNWRKLHKSYTVVLAMVLTILSAVQANLPIIAAQVDPAMFSWITFGVGIAIMIGRYIMQESVDDPSDSPEAK